MKTIEKTEHILFLTGKLAYPGLVQILEDMQSDAFTYSVRNLGLSVASMMTTNIIKRRLKDIEQFNRIILPGRFRGNLDELSSYFGVPFERGPEELKDIPAFFGKKHQYDLSDSDVLIIGEIVEAVNLSPQATLDIALRYRTDGADVIDIGFMPDTPFPQLADTIALLKEHNFKVSVDTHNNDQLLAASHYGADYLLSLKRDTLWIADESEATPIVIPDTPQEIETLYQCIEQLEQKNRAFIADPILDPIHYGFIDSLARYHRLRQDYPHIEMMMGIGNLSELTHADTAGINTLLLGIISELNIGYLLTTQVSEHCRCVIREVDLARRIMHAARLCSSPPAGITNGLMALHERHPFPYRADEIKAIAESIKDDNYRIQLSEKGIHVYNRDLYKVATDPFDFYTDLNVSDNGGHAFYLGVELARAQIAWQLGKRYDQDEELLWGCAVEPKEQDLSAFKEAGVTLKERREKIKNRKKHKINENT
ncbi:MAG: dihydropteroate synthase [Chromatiales bacterium]|nr:dihydropteroate synthase [Chromatiales bacterium]